MKVLALNPGSRHSKNVARDLLWGCWCKGKRIAGVQFPPLPLLYVGTILKEEGNEVHLLDAAGEGLDFEDVRERVRREKYDLAFLISATMSFNEDAGTLADLKSVHPELKTAVFGAHATFKPHEALDQPGVDVIVRREAEWVVRDLVRAWNAGGDEWKSVKGIGFKEDGEYRINDYYPFIQNLDELPIPDRSLLPQGIEYYNPIVKKVPATTALSSRGCPSLCTFCTAPSFYGPRYRARSPENCIEELTYLADLGFKEVFYRDELFTVMPKRTKAICEGILDAGIDLAWICSVKVGTVDREILGLMREAGCHMIRIGVESGNQELLDNVKKGVRVEEIEQTFAWCHEVGMDVHAHMMLGMPGETHDTIDRSLTFIDKIRPTTVTYGITTPYPGTPLYEDVVERYPELGDGSQIDVRTIHTNGSANEHFTGLAADELSRYVRQAYKRFYMRPGYMWKMLRRCNNVDDVRRLSLAGANVVDFVLRGDE